MTKLVWKSVIDLAAKNNSSKFLQPKGKLSSEAPKSMLSNYICKKKQSLEDVFWKIRHIQIKIYPQTPIEIKYGAFYLKNKVRVHGLVLLGQLS